MRSCTVCRPTKSVNQYVSQFQSGRTRRVPAEPKDSNGMREISVKGVQARHSANDLEMRVLAALRKAGLDPEKRLSPTGLAALDHFHTGGFRASLVLRDLAQIRAADRIHDIGAGMAGPARMLAANPGCQVECIDLSQDYCAAASRRNSGGPRAGAAEPVGLRR